MVEVHHFSRKWKSSSKVGPLSPTVSECSSSLTFIPLFVVIAVPSLFFLTHLIVVVFVLFD